MSIGENIRHYRKTTKLTQNQLAEIMGVSFQAVSSWERDEYAPETSKLQLLAGILKTSVSSLLAETEDHALQAEAPADCVCRRRLGLHAKGIDVRCEGVALGAAAVLRWVFCNR